MANLSDLSPSPGSRKRRKRIGRGNGSGHGGTSTKGHKGLKARTGGKVHPRREGGQTPLIRRIPKRGFTNIERVEYQVVNLRDLERIEGDVSPETLKAAGLIGSVHRPVKVLGTGEIARAARVSAHKFSGSAKAKIEAAGGSASVIGPEASAAS
ncbi:MAG: 50S ribosomal protein L15 [Gemmatimonadetes bacterium]|nr:50S ribosomal protein L15 [Gemmatimonadota bacterium]